MIKYAKIIDEKTGLAEAGLGTNTEYYKSIGMTPLDIEQSDINGNWYLKEKCPKKSEEELLNEARAFKKAETSKKAYEYINNGALFEFEPGKHIEANDGNISKLGLAAVELVLNQDTESTVEWCTAEDEIVNLNAEQLQVVVQGLKSEQTRVWVELYPAFLADIEQAQTVEDVNAIVIDYAQKSLKLKAAKKKN